MFLQCFVAGLIGMLLQVFLVKLPSLQLRYKTANERLTLGAFLQAEWITLCGSALTILAIVYCLDEVLGLKPDLVKVIKWLFVFVGFTGSSIIMAMFSRTAKVLNGIVDEKTNVADGKGGSA